MVTGNDTPQSTSAENSDNQQKPPSYFIAIGASAGGFEALQEFFRSMPADSGATFFVIQHLSPDFKSIMAELLNRTSEMTAHNAQDGTQAEANNIYLIPPGKNMMIAEGRLILSDRIPERGPNFPIDIFFRSLAEDQQHRSIGIVLSGTGSDGSRGIQAIKEAGGLILVQDPNSAKFDGMPYNAVKTGFSDLITTPGEMPAKLTNYINHPIISGQERSVLHHIEDQDAVLREILELLNKKSHNDFSQYKPSTIARRLERRMGINQMTKLDEYHELLVSSNHELQTLAKDMLIGVTRFFRDDDAFKELEESIIPAIVDDSPIESPIRIWIAGCSSGEEAYSIAIIFHEVLKKKKLSRSVKVFATDVDPDAITEASLGTFAQNIENDMSEARLNTYFTQEGNHYVVIPPIRNMIVFAVHNLIKDPPFSNINLVSCRNVLIYFQTLAQKRVLSMLHFALQRHGILFLGASESLGDVQSHFDVISDRNKVFKKQVSTRIPTEGALTKSNIRHRSDQLPSSMERLMRNYQGASNTASYTNILEKIVTDYIPPCVILNEQWEIQHVYGDIAPYTGKIKSGRFSSKILDLIVDDLTVALSTALRRAVTEKNDIHYKGVMIKTGDDKTFQGIDLRVRYIPSANGSFNLAILFESLHAPSTPEDEKRSIHYDASEQSQQRIRDLESELQKSRESLQVTVEELETTNEELQASNEELLAANEELQSTNEELQSVNEELYTVNSEYQEKIEEITRINTDIDNIMKSTDIGIIFLDRDMLIRSFTPAATQQVNLLDSDIGRPFHHIAHNLKYRGLLSDIAQVIETHQTKEKEISTLHSDAIIVRIYPYYDENHAANGCVITLTNISRIKHLEGKLTRSYHQLRTTIGTSLLKAPKKISVLVVDDDQVDIETIVRALQEIKESELSIEQAHNSADTIKLLREKTYDICIIDYMLDGCTAFELLDTLPKHNDTPFILFSGLVDEKVHEKALSLGIYDVIAKDELSAPLLARSIRYTMRHKQTEKYLSTEMVEKT